MIHQHFRARRPEIWVSLSFLNTKKSILVVPRLYALNCYPMPSHPLQSDMHFAEVVELVANLVWDPSFHHSGSNCAPQMVLDVMMFHKIYRYRTI